MKKLIMVGLMLTTLTGCGLMQPKVQTVYVDDPYCTAIKTIPYKSTVKPIETSKYENIKISARDQNGVRVIEVQVDDFEGIVQLLQEVESGLRARENEIRAFEEYYDPAKFKKIEQQREELKKPWYKKIFD